MLRKPVISIPSSTLAGQLTERISREGPITFRDWMDLTLYHPTEGYYNRTDRKRWGREGDYRTNPERSDLFAATFARYFAGLYEELGRPASLTIVEMGGGDGRFARGVLCALQESFTEVFESSSLIFAELSVDSRNRAQELLAPFGNRVRFEALKNLDRISTGIVFSNELVDAFPVHGLTNKSGKLFELYVTVTTDEKFELIPGPLSTPALSQYCLESGIVLGENQIVEVNLAIDEWIEGLSEKLLSGYLITVDYGAETSELVHDPARYRGTLRAFHQHRIIDDVLARPGELDITASVDWTHVKRSGERSGFDVVEFSAQDRFLLQAGLLAELERQTSAGKGDAEKLRLATSAREMILPGGMASSFQVLVQKRIRES